MNEEEYWRQGIEKLPEMHKRMMGLVKGMPEPRRTQVTAMLEGPVGQQYLEAPASTRRGFHNAFPGGLLMHSLNVYDNLVKLADALCPGKFSRDKLAFCALFHDLGKAGDLDHPHYLPSKEEWKKKRGEFYSVNPKLQWMPTSERGLFVLQKFGIVLDVEETLAIRLNDGPGLAENKPYAFHEPRLSLLVHWADFWASLDEKEAGREREGLS